MTINTPKVITLRVGSEINVLHSRTMTDNASGVSYPLTLSCSSGDVFKEGWSSCEITDWRSAPSSSLIDWALNTDNTGETLYYEMFAKSNYCRVSASKNVPGIWEDVRSSVTSSLQICCWVLKLIHAATPDTTKLSCLCRVRFGGVNWIPDNSRLSPTENLKSEHVQSNRPVDAGTPYTTQTGPSCRVWYGGVNWALRDWLLPFGEAIQTRVFWQNI